MPVLASFYGIVIRMFFRDIEKHNSPHIHADYQGRVAVYSIPDGEILAGSLPASKHKFVTTWIEIHKEELLKDWLLSVNGRTLLPIKGLEYDY